MQGVTGVSAVVNTIVYERDNFTHAGNNGIVYVGGKI
jgi:hypothetical protein